MLKRKFISRVLRGLSDLTLDRSGWRIPDVSLLPEPMADTHDPHPTLTGEGIEGVLSHYSVDASYVDCRIGAAVTTYEVRVPVGTRFSQILRYRDDIARDLGVPSLRIIKSIGDSSLVGLEVENEDRLSVHFKDMFLKIPKGLRLPVIIGEDTYSRYIYEDLTKMPHVLIAGQTGSGKSVFLNTTVATLVCSKTPEELRLLIVDPKQVEFTQYEDVPHLYEKDGKILPIASDPDSARYLLDTAVEEMEHRFKMFRDIKVKKISDYNEKVSDKLPYVVFIVDELSDLMLMGTRDQRKDVENKIIRIAQKARAVGIHMILSTQKPLATVVTSLIKANMPARISFSVTSGVDSRVILDDTGAETLTGYGDMLFHNPIARCNLTRLQRVQAPWLSDSDLNFLLSQGA